MRYLVLTLGLFLFCTGCGREQAQVAVSASARSALNSGDVERAREIAEGIAIGDPEYAEAQFVLADIALLSNDLETAIAHLQSVPRDGSPGAIIAATNQGQFEYETGKLHSAITNLAYVVEHQPERNDVRHRLARLYANTGQHALADQQFRVLVTQPEFSREELIVLTDIDRHDPNVGVFLQQCYATGPDDPAVNLGLAMEAVFEADMDAALEYAQVAVEKAPDLAAAQGLLGELLLDEVDSEAKLQAWHAALPESVQDAPEVWFARGLWAQQRGESEIAARCLWECARQIPTSYRATYQLGLAMNDVDPEVGQEFSDRALQIYELRQHLSDALNSQGTNDAAVRHMIELLIDMGREWEAFSWTIMSSESYPNASWVDRAFERLPDYPHTDAPRVITSKNLLVLHDLSHLPDHSGLLVDVAGQGHDTDARDGAGIRFAEQAADVGVQFTYHQGRMEGMTGVRMQESTGGGVAVLDFDLNGMPDLFFTQGEDWLADEHVPTPSDQYRDQLFRNHGDGFVEVTEWALAQEGGFGQGCSTGDFNNDGFVDLYVANAGVNQLWLNMGDGTFHDATEELGLTASAWTTSCLIADLNADGSPDLFDVNYVEGEELFRIICDEHNCSPDQYQSALDHLFLSQGDGTIRPFDLSSVEPDGGPGLAVVAFRVDHADGIAAGSSELLANGGSRAPSPIVPNSERLCLFVANDHAPNYFLVNSPSVNSDNVEFNDVGYVSGLAVNYLGKATACMGVASGDANGDGLLDFFVTNYKDEANNLYLQSPGGYFTDAIAGAGLLASDMPYVGWGTQFLDADNDGRLDLVATNGHVGDFRKPDVEYYFPTQFYYNSGGGEFRELFSESVGPFFAEKRLGRGLATLDWNRDGQVDVVISSIASPASLLTNETSDAGNFIALRLHAVTSARDAIGSKVSLTTPLHTVHQQLTAGDGYQATNERVLHFGLGDESQIDQIVIEWPNGSVQSLTNAPANTLIDVVEDRPEVTVWTGPTPAAWDASPAPTEPPDGSLQQ